MKCRYFQYGLKPIKKQRKNSESYGSATHCVWNYCLELNQADLNIQYEAINIISRTGTVRIQARGDTSGGDVVYDTVSYDTSSHVSMNREKFLSNGKEAALLWVRGSPLN
jgi:hypothetical protein